MSRAHAQIQWRMYDPPGAITLSKGQPVVYKIFWKLRKCWSVDVGEDGLGLSQCPPHKICASDRPRISQTFRGRRFTPKKHWWIQRGAPGIRPPLVQMSFIFLQFLGKNGQLIDWHPHLGGWRPRLGNPGSAAEKRKCTFIGHLPEKLTESAK